MFACQGFGAADSIKNYVGIWTGKYLSKLLGYVPARKVGSEENESYYCMKQWFDWNLTGKLIGENGVDYRKKMKLIQIPVLSIYGSGDKFIAPPKGCESFLDSFKNPINRRLFCAKQKGFLEDYNHSRILHSKSASQDIYPKVWNFIENHTPIAAP
jgi:predicted alpha/beta hydrolase